MQALDGRFVANQIKGERDYQEDDFGLLDNSETTSGAEHSLMVLTDGMGGHKGGDIASSIATRTFLDIYEHSSGTVAKRLEKALIAANAGIARGIENNKNLTGMGTTIVAVVVTDAGLEWISVGDSPMWLYQNGRLKQLNEDHSMAPVLDDLVAVGRLSEEEKAKDNRKNALRSALMGDEIPIIDTSSTPLTLHSDDYLIMASDGLQTLSTKTIEKTLKKHVNKGLEQCVVALLEGVEKANKEHQDNCTVILYQPRTYVGENGNVINNKATELGLWARMTEKISNLFGKIGSR